MYVRFNYKDTVEREATIELELPDDTDLSKGNLESLLWENEEFLEELDKEADVTMIVSTDIDVEDTWN